MCTGTFWGGTPLTKTMTIDSSVTQRQLHRQPSLIATTWHSAAEVQEQTVTTNAVPCSHQSEQTKASVTSAASAGPRKWHMQKQAKPALQGALHDMLQQQQQPHAHDTAQSHIKAVPAASAARLAGNSKPVIRSLPKPALHVKAAAGMQTLQHAAEQISSDISRSALTAPALGRAPQLKKPSAVRAQAPATPAAAKPPRASKPKAMAKRPKADATVPSEPPCAGTASVHMNAHALEQHGRKPFIGSQAVPHVSTEQTVGAQQAEVDKLKPPPRKRAKPDDLDANAVEKKMQEKHAAALLQDLNTNELKVALKARKLPVGGKKCDLVARLQQCLQAAR